MVGYIDVLDKKVIVLLLHHVHSFDKLDIDRIFFEFFPFHCWYCYLIICINSNIIYLVIGDIISISIISISGSSNE